MKKKEKEADTTGNASPNWFSNKRSTLGRTRSCKKTVSAEKRPGACARQNVFPGQSLGKTQLSCIDPTGAPALGPHRCAPLSGVYSESAKDSVFR
ncbi:hypothetical protein WN55_10855 [Dufourea novaeangliae]|uniref:Uncharacterized protein n=1 Tax=Dufourea novaeangliae TaxID=178035 RepID=A0A154P9N7_DUFNO|nr:hypothetical protein WN55_10855 [Dufourea novaeangliae]